MSTDSYLDGAIENTPAVWWHDSADPVELQRGLDRGAVGVTTNPFLSSVALAKNRQAMPWPRGISLPKLKMKWRNSCQAPKKKAGARQRPRMAHNLKPRLYRGDVLLHTPAII